MSSYLSRTRSSELAPCVVCDPRSLVRFPGAQPRANPVPQVTALAGKAWTELCRSSNTARCSSGTMNISSSTDLLRAGQGLQGLSERSCGMSCRVVTLVKPEVDGPARAKDAHGLDEVRESEHLSYEFYLALRLLHRAPCTARGPRQILKPRRSPAPTYSPPEDLAKLPTDKPTPQAAPQRQVLANRLRCPKFMSDASGNEVNDGRFCIGSQPSCFPRLVMAFGLGMYKLLNNWGRTLEQKLGPKQHHSPPGSRPDHICESRSTQAQARLVHSRPVLHLHALLSFAVAFSSVLLKFLVCVRYRASVQKMQQLIAMHPYSCQLQAYLMYA